MTPARTSQRKFGTFLTGMAALVVILAACNPSQGPAAGGSTATPKQAAQSSPSSNPICPKLAEQLETLNFFPNTISLQDNSGAISMDTDIHNLQSTAPADLKPQLKGLDKVMEAAITKPASYTESAFVKAKNTVEDWGLKYC
ncbi:hypothetical protein GCM10025779_27590 [Arthrobacter cryoconiti]